MARICFASGLPSDVSSCGIHTIQFHIGVCSTCFWNVRASWRMEGGGEGGEAEQSRVE